MMKKVLMIGLAVTMIFIGTNAVADEEPLCGFIDVLSINLWESDQATDVPIAPSDLRITFTPDDEEVSYKLPARAYGTQLNLALLKALNFAETLYGCMAFEINQSGEFVLKITNVSVDTEKKKKNNK